MSIRGFAVMANAPSKVWTIVKREYLERVRTKWFVIATIFGPLIFAGLIFGPMAMNQQDSATTALYNITVIDATTTGLGERVAQLIGGGKYANQMMPEVTVVPAHGVAQAESTLSHDIQNQRASGYLVVDSETVAGRSATYVGRRANSQPEMLQVASALREGIIGMRLEQRHLSPDQIDSITIVSPILHTEQFGQGGRGATGEAKTFLALFVAFFLYMSILLYGQSMLSGVIEEKMTRVAEVVLSSIRPSALLAGKVIGVSAVGLTQQVIWILGSLGLLMLTNSGHGSAVAPTSDNKLGALSTGIIAAAKVVPATWLMLVVLFFILGFIFFGSLYAAVGATVSSESEARQAAQPLTLLLVVTFVFISPVVSDPNGTLAQVWSMLPFSAPILMPLRMALADVPATQVVGSIVILLASCGAAIWLAARIYRVGLLMYGKRPTLTEMARWVREG